MVRLTAKTDDLTICPRHLRIKQRRSVLPGFGLTMGFTLLYLSLIVLIPLGALLVLKSATIRVERFLAGGDRSAGGGLLQAELRGLAGGGRVNAVFGFIVAWVLVRYSFPGKRFLDAMVDLPSPCPRPCRDRAHFALQHARLDRPLVGAAGDQGGLHAAGGGGGLTFIGLPFVVRTLQPALEDLDPEIEEAAASLGAGRLADLPPRDLAQRAAGVAVRLCLGTGPRAGRIRLGGLHRRQPAHGDRNHAVPDHQQARTVRLRRGDGHRRGHVGGVVCVAVVINVLQWWSRRHA